MAWPRWAFGFPPWGHCKELEDRNREGLSKLCWSCSCFLMIMMKDQSDGKAIVAALMEYPGLCSNLFLLTHSVMEISFRSLRPEHLVDSAAHLLPNGIPAEPLIFLCVLFLPLFLISRGILKREIFWLAANFRCLFLSYYFFMWCGSTCPRLFLDHAYNKKINNSDSEHDVIVRNKVVKFSSKGK